MGVIYDNEIKTVQLLFPTTLSTNNDQGGFFLYCKYLNQQKVGPRISVLDFNSPVLLPDLR